MSTWRTPDSASCCPGAELSVHSTASRYFIGAQCLFSNVSSLSCNKLTNSTLNHLLSPDVHLNDIEKNLMKCSHNRDKF